MSQSSKHMKMTEEHKQKLIAINKTRKLSEEQKQVLLKANLGRKASETTKLKMSLANHKRKEIYCYQTNQKYHSIREAARCLNIDNSAIAKVLKKKNKHAGGYTFEYI